MKKLALILTVTILATAGTIAAYEFLGLGKKEIIYQQDNSSPAVKYIAGTPPSNPGTLDFTSAAEKSTPAVVHITATRVQTYQQVDPFRDLFGDDFFRSFPSPSPGQRERRSQASGSGVIIREDGYIVTNNHVINGAEELKVVLHNKESYSAEIIGTDPTTDLALIKIEADALPFLAMSNSDEVRIGEWVLAVGNPFNLESTVTAGIVSAKGRNINILKEQYSIESFIQTDAAVNPGNSGGALVNTNGDLIGINTAIATPTGTYAGYSFAVPSNIVRKVAEDLMKYGIVQRGFLGVMIRDVDGNLAEELDLDVSRGVLIDKLVEDGSAAEYGLEAGDVIVAVDGKDIGSSPELQETIGSKRPGDNVQVTVNRNGREKTIDVTLRNKDGEARIIEKEDLAPTDVLGVELKPLPEKEQNRYRVNGGVVVTKIHDGKISKHTRMREGFVITSIDGITMNTPEDVERFFNEKTSGGVMIEGFYPGTPGKTFYGFGLD